MNIHKNIHEMEIKIFCARWLEQRGKDAIASTIINEFSANKSKVRADLVFVSENEIVAVEIKSSKDKISRLEGQISHLKKLYNRVEVITTEKHLEASRTICSKMQVGLNIIKNGTITTILKGRRRKIEEFSLSNRLFPKHMRARKDFIPSEEAYRSFLLNKYGRPQIIHTLDEQTDFDYLKIRQMNPHYITRIDAIKKREAYHRSLENLSTSLQSTHSSSKCSVDKSIP